MNKFGSFIFISLAFLATSNSQETDDYLKNLEYPELVVTPLASQRLQDEARNESKTKWTSLASIQVSGLLTFLAGKQADGDYDTKLNSPNSIAKNKERVDNASQLAQTIGAAWFVGASILSLTYSPYSAGLDSIKNLPKKSKQQKLARERMAEEKLNTAGDLAKKLKYLSALTNVLANGYLLAETQEDSQITAGVALIGALAPFIFPSHWETVSDLHKGYKKKIYGPVSNITPTSRGYVPTLGLAMTF